MRARIISRLQRGGGGRECFCPNPLNEGQDYIPATTPAPPNERHSMLKRSMRARIISRLQHALSRDLRIGRARSMRARIISRLQPYADGKFETVIRALNEGQDYIPATTGRSDDVTVEDGLRSMRARIISRLQPPHAAVVHGHREHRSMRARIISRLQLPRQVDLDLMDVLRSMRARIISRLQRCSGRSWCCCFRALNEGQDYIPATTPGCRRGLRCRTVRSMRARIISRLQHPRSEASPPLISSTLNEGQDYIPATT